MSVNEMKGIALWMIGTYCVLFTILILNFINNLPYLISIPIGIILLVISFSIIIYGSYFYLKIDLGG